MGWPGGWQVVGWVGGWLVELGWKVVEEGRLGRGWLLMEKGWERERQVQASWPGLGRARAMQERARGEARGVGTG